MSWFAIRQTFIMQSIPDIQWRTVCVLHHFCTLYFVLCTTIQWNLCFFLICYLFLELHSIKLWRVNCSPVLLLLLLIDTLNSTKKSWSSWSGWTLYISKSILLSPFINFRMFFSLAQIFSFIYKYKAKTQNHCLSRSRLLWKQ